VEAADWDDRYAGTDMVWSTSPNAFFAEAVEAIRPGRAIDLGAGEGRNALWLAERGWDVTAVDFSAAGIDKGRRLAEHRGVEVSWLAEDLRTWRPDTEAYELVGVVYVHFPRPQRDHLVSASLAAVAPGGTWVWVGHDADNIEHGHGGPQDPAVLATVDELVAHLEPSEWRIVRSGQVRRTVTIESGHGIDGGAAATVTAIDQLVVAVRS
jgi:SAM-dependent methyltransferase